MKNIKTMSTSQTSARASTTQKFRQTTTHAFYAKGVLILLIMAMAQLLPAQNTTTYWGYEIAQGGTYNSNFGAYAGNNANDNSNAGYNSGFKLTGSGNSNCGSNSGREATMTNSANYGFAAGLKVTGNENCNFGSARADKPQILMTGDSNFGYGVENIGSKAVVTSQYNCRFGAFDNNDNRTLSSTRSVLVGYNAGLTMSSGSENVLIGAQSGIVSTSASSGNVCMGFLAGNGSVNVGHSVYLGYNAQGKSETGTYNPLYEKSPSFTLNNQFNNARPLLFGYFSGQYDDAPRASLAVNTSYVKSNVTLTVNGPAYVGEFGGINYKNIPVRPALLQRYSLFVEKGILSVDFAIASVDKWADYVFEDDYKLKSLYEVEQYVKTHKHLPEIAAAETLEKEGMSVKDMYKNFMLKIEELTLYAIEQDK